jgi:hypothetical protein
MAKLQDLELFVENFPLLRNLMDKGKAFQFKSKEVEFHHL